MREFKFSLEKVLVYRLQLEKQAKNNYASIQKIVNDKQDNIQKVVQEKKQMLSVPEYTVSRMQVQQRYIADLDRIALTLQTEIDSLQGKLRDALEEYVNAQQKRKIMEKLKENKKADYIILEKREEQKLLDELSNRRILNIK
ncbi:flagellar export protein FliJ [Ligilactobacillus sp. WILCCON 0076]|uniref:Flagellar FliJ protein n=1 Tax=Ligilactobacillus ubinensis TaxID=2876789 RepID=A0A9X2FKY1_9LACO|nr:flagellar export protein FliJ [Ligilactobacillus ubinensis]MCP0886248.1 flagellar export protein FliJ [Ligilactobacillus ubinensis]